MAKISPNAPCPCGRDAKLKRCCGRVHQGRPPSPEALVRARYTAYAMGRVGFIIDTTHPSAPHYRGRDDRAAWRSELQDYCRTTEFVGLQIHEHTIDEDADEAWVRFTVDLRRDGRPAGFTEHSRFLKEGTRWRYVSGELS